MFIEKEDFWILLVTSVRYSLGRKTFLVLEVERIIEKYRKHITEGQRALLRGEMLHWVKVAEGRGILLGDQMTHDAWLRLINSLKPFEKFVRLNWPKTRDKKL